MPYTVQLKGQPELAHAFLSKLKARTSKRFSNDKFTYNTRVIGDTLQFGVRGRRPKDFTKIEFTQIRLAEAKEYCGNHPGECFVNPFVGEQKKRKSRCLEWVDWVRFNNLLNDILNEMKMEANIWSRPPEKMDKGSIFWIRRNNQRRVIYDWEEVWDRGGNRPSLIWNHGTPDQFGA